MTTNDELAAHGFHMADEETMDLEDETPKRRKNDDDDSDDDNFSDEDEDM